MCILYKFLCIYLLFSLEASSWQFNHRPACWIVIQSGLQGYSTLHICNFKPFSVFCDRVLHLIMRVSPASIVYPQWSDLHVKDSWLTVNKNTKYIDVKTYSPNLKILPNSMHWSYMSDMKYELTVGKIMNSNVWLYMSGILIKSAQYIQTYCTVH